MGVQGAMRSTRLEVGGPQIDVDQAVSWDFQLHAEGPMAAVDKTPFKMARFSIDRGLTTLPDAHDVKEMWVVEEGRCAIILNGIDHAASQGDVFLLAPGETHQVRAIKGRATLLSIWWP